jgi:hypothetical protein
MSSEKIQIPSTNIINQDRYPGKENLTVCNTCKNIAIKPFFCESCSVVFCKYCIQDLNTTNCPLCSKELTVCTDKYFDYFKDLTVRCPKCEAGINFRDILTHICNNPSEAHEDVQLINGVICFRCNKCYKYIPYNEKLAHQCKDLTSSSEVKSNVGMPTSTKVEIKEPEFSRLILDNKPQANDISLLTVELARSLGGFMNKIERSDFNELIQSISLLNTSINGLTKLNNTSFCKLCKTVGKLFNLAKCDCCKNSYCTGCCVPCEKCTRIFSKKCLVVCKSCSLTYCPYCQYDINIGCMCSETKYCKTCLSKPNVYNNLSLGLLSNPHLDCKFMKVLDINVFVMKLFDFKFQCDIGLNSQRQLISISVIKDKIEVSSKLFQINLNDKILVVYDKEELKTSSSIDYWAINVKKAFTVCDFLIFNFNTNPNYSFMLNKLNNSKFDELAALNVGRSGMLVGGLFQQNIQLINNVQFKKIIN